MKVRHPNLNEPNVLEVDAKLGKRYLAAGWVEVDAKPAPATPTTKAVSGPKE